MIEPLPAIPPMQPTEMESLPSDVGIRKAYAGMTAILLGGLGVHKYLLGYSGTGTIMLLLSLLTCGVGWIAMWVIGIIEGITYLTSTDEDFYRTYLVGRRPWL